MGPDQFEQQGAQDKESYEQTEALKKENYALKAQLAEQDNKIKNLKTQLEQILQLKEEFEKQDYQSSIEIEKLQEEKKTLEAQLEQQKSVDESYSEKLKEISDKILKLENDLEKALYAQELSHLQNGFKEAQRHRDMLNAPLIGDTTASDARPSPWTRTLPLTTIPENRPTGRTNPDHRSEEVGIC